MFPAAVPSPVGQLDVFVNVFYLEGKFEDF
jgi:hypothetical protein